MSDDRLLLTRRSFLHTAPMGTAGALILRPTPAEARWGVALTVFRIGGYGLGAALGGAIALGLLAYGAASAVGHGLHSAFSGDNRSGGHGGYSYAAYHPRGWKKYTPPKPIVISVSCDPDGQIAGDVLRLRAIEFDILKNDGIILPSGGRLIIKEDGKMQFADTTFRGYARMQNNSDLSVFTPDDHLVLTRCPRGSKFHCMHHDSHDGRTALVSLLGDIRHV